MKIEFISNTFKQSDRGGEYADSIVIIPTIIFYRDVTDVDGNNNYKYSVGISFLIFEFSVLFKKEK